MNLVTVADVLALVKDYSRNQNLDSTRGIRTIDSATDYVLSLISAPGSEREYSFYFFEDQPTYATPTGFGEEFFLRYDNDDLNKNQQFSWKPGELLYSRRHAVGANTRLWGITYSTGAPQLTVLAKNKVAGTLIDTMDSSATYWTGTNDATNLVDDPYTKKEGNGSLKFDVDVSASVLNRATITRTITVSDFSTQQDLGYFKCWVYIPNITNFTSISFNWGNDASNYFKTTVTAQEDGTAFTVGWNAISFAWLGAMQVGTVNTQQIDTIWMDFDYAVAYVSTDSFRVDYIRMVVPDLMKMSYYSLYKGTDTTGASELATFTATTDKFYFYDTIIKQMIAVQAAVLLNPQIIVNDEAVRRIFRDLHTTFVRRYPRKRIRNLMMDPSIARTSTQQ